MGYNYTDVVIPLTGLTATDKLVLINLAFRANNETGECWQGASLIAAETGLHKVTVYDTLQRLESLKYLTKAPPTRGGRTSNTYTLQMHALVAASIAPAQARAKRKYTRKPKPETTNLNFEDEEDGLSNEYPKGTALLNFTEADADLS